jgi:thiamine biosynthesis lipoprotein
MLGPPLLALAVAAQAGPAHHQQSRVSMACTYTIEAYGDQPSLPAILESGLDEVDRIDRLMSHYKPASQLSRLNREAALRPVAVSRELFDFLSLCLREGRDSDGAFDVTVGPLMKAWGFFRGEGRLPEATALAEARQRTGYQHVVLDEAALTVRFARQGMELDLGGIAKGYAVDRVVALLRERGVASALVSAGGSTLYALGAPPGTAGWNVSVADPVDGTRTATRLTLRDRALSMSGSSEKVFEKDGRRYSHVMDPRTGRPVSGVLAVAVVTDTGTRGDALDNSFFVAGVEKTRSRLRELDGTQVMFFLPRGRSAWTSVKLGPGVN